MFAFNKIINKKNVKKNDFIMFGLLSDIIKINKKNSYNVKLFSLYISEEK